MDDVDAFITNGELNTCNIFIEDEPHGDQVKLNIAGEAVFTLELSHPFSMGCAANPEMAALVNAKRFASIHEVLQCVTELNAAAVESDDGSDTLEEPPTKERHHSAKEDEMLSALRREQFSTGNLTPSAVHRILADYSLLMADTTAHGWSCKPCGKDLSRWDIELFNFDEGTRLYSDMKMVKARTESGSVHLVMNFPADYPLSPPFIRVVRPRFVLHTGRVTVGGSLCFKLLVPEGWSPVVDIQNVITNVRFAITDPDAGAAIDHSNPHDYTEAEAREAFHRIAAEKRLKGWD